MGEGILSKEELNKLLGKEDDLLRKSGRAVESSGKLGKERLYMRELFFCELKDRFFHMIPYRKKRCGTPTPNRWTQVFRPALV